MTATIKAKDAVPGRWYEVDGSRMLFINEVSGDYWFADIYSDQSGYAKDADITPLPGCTGWDWEPGCEVEASPASPTISKDHYDCLHQRMRWMEIRSEGKDQIGWDSNYDRRERDALRAILAVVRPEEEPTPKHPPIPDPGEGWRIAEGEDWKDERCEIWVQGSKGGFWDERVNKGKPFTHCTYRIPIDPAPKHPPVPEGWRELSRDEVVAAGDKLPRRGQWHNVIADIGVEQRLFDYPHIRRIEPTYRPFASAAEFTPHRDRWLYSISNKNTRRVDHYSEGGVNGVDWISAFKKWTFDDGTPFGVEVKE